MASELRGYWEIAPDDVRVLVEYDPSTPNTARDLENCRLRQAPLCRGGKKRSFRPVLPVLQSTQL